MSSTTVTPDKIECLLEISGLTKWFTGTLALDHVDFDVRRGEIHALLGQNGAGKSTLIKILAGVYPPASGEIRFNDVPVSPASQKLPVNFIHQDLGLVDSMTVAENVAVFAGYQRRGGLINWRATAQAATRALTLMDSDIDPGARVATLRSAEKSIVAIARALAVNCELLVLDEPTAALPEADVGRLFNALKRLRDQGIGIIYVTHRLDEVFRLADRVTVLRDGRKIATNELAAFSAESLVSMIVGRRVANTIARPVETGGTCVLQITDLRASGVGPVSFQIQPGEVLGLVGLRGSGHDVVGRALFGDRIVMGGTIQLDGRPITPHSPGGAMAMGIGFISSKRGEESLAASMSLQENIYLNPKLTGAHITQPIRRAIERRNCEAVLARYSVRPADPTRPIATLSGGNQQKVVVARWLEGHVRLLILEEPTIGVDVGSKAEIYGLLQNSLGNGMAALLISSDFEEVAKVCNRAFVFNRGRVVEELDRSRVTVSILTALAAGASLEEVS
jgi:ribose transport system ATP-binding protein